MTNTRASARQDNHGIAAQRLDQARDVSSESVRIDLNNVLCDHQLERRTDGIARRDVLVIKGHHHTAAIGPPVIAKLWKRTPATEELRADGWPRGIDLAALANLALRTVHPSLFA